MTFRARSIAFFAAAAALAIPASAHIGTLPMGRYQCALPGDATGVPFHVQNELSFRITGASSYSAEDGRGTYLLDTQNDVITFTRGPRKDMKLKRMRSGILQWVKEDGSLGRIRCSRVGK